MRIILILLLLPAAAGCAVKAIKGTDAQGREWMILKGFGAKKATWKDGTSIEKEEPFHVPNIMTK